MSCRTVWTVAGRGAPKAMRKISYQGWDDCLLLTDGRIELVVTTVVGPRIIRFGFAGERNLFFEKPEDLGESGGPTWRLYGGHRFWHAPEAFPRTYSPDNSPVRHEWTGGVLKLVQAVEPETGIRKEMEVTLHPGSGQVSVLHRAVNQNPWEIELSPWCPTALAAGGRAILPQEEYRPHPEYLLPARPLALWHYTDMSDPRWTWGRRYVQLRQDPKLATKQKIGVLNTPGWAAYSLDDFLFIKRFGHDPGARYPDFGCNTEIFTDAEMLEIESLGPLTRLPPLGGSVEWVEKWRLHRAWLGLDEDALDQTLRPLLRSAVDGPKRFDGTGDFKG